MLFQSHQPKVVYLYIATSDGSIESLNSTEGGHCKTHHMKLHIYICRDNGIVYNTNNVKFKSWRLETQDMDKNKTSRQTVAIKLLCFRATNPGTSLLNFSDQ